VWPTPLLPNADANFSGILFSQMRLLFEAKGGSAFLPGPKRDARFTLDNHGNNPVCSDDGDDIYVIASYTPRPDGTPFTFSYEIRQGGAVRTGSVARDIEEEWRSGRLSRFHKTQPLAMAINDDLRSRAQFLLEQLKWGKVGDSHRTILAPPAPAPVGTRISGDTAIMTIAPTHLRKLTGSEIQRLLAGRTLSYVLEPGVVSVSSQYRQTFLEDGSVVVALDRANKRGRYRVLSDQLCVVLEPEGREECSQLFVSTDTHYYIAPIGSGYIKQKPLKIMIE
jgi:hypothetical protein